MHVHLKPSTDPARKPPSAVFKLSSFSRRLADANLVNSYVPPTAAVVLSDKAKAKLDNHSRPTKHSDCASCLREHSPWADVPLG